MAMPITWRTFGFSFKKRCAKRAVKKIWVWPNKDAIPGESPILMAQIRKENLKMPIKVPKIIILRQLVWGLGSKKIPGKTDKRERKATNNKGGISAEPIFMVIKFDPHTAEINTASIICLKEREEEWEFDILATKKELYLYI